MSPLKWSCVQKCNWGIFEIICLHQIGAIVWDKPSRTWLRLRYQQVSSTWIILLDLGVDFAAFDGFLLIFELYIPSWMIVQIYRCRVWNYIVIISVHTISSWKNYLLQTADWDILRFHGISWSGRVDIRTQITGWKYCFHWSWINEKGSSLEFEWFSSCRE